MTLRTRAPSVWIALALLGCGGPPSGERPTGPGDCAAKDADGDGSSACEDCDDTDPTVHPGAVDAWYDGVDSDCDGADDFDADGDGDQAQGHGGTDCDDADPSVSGLDLDGDGLSSCQDDCADDDPAVHPAAGHPCNGVDDNCDGLGDCHLQGYYSYPAPGVPELVPVDASIGVIKPPAEAAPVILVPSDLGTREIYLLPTDWTGTLLTTDAIATFPGTMYDYADVTGDGIADVVTFTTTSRARIRSACTRGLTRGRTRQGMRRRRCRRRTAVNTACSRSTTTGMGSTVFWLESRTSPS